MERRTHERYTAAYPLEWAEEESVDTCEIENISKGGVSFFVRGNSKNTGDRVTVRVFLKKRMFSLESEIMYIRPISGEIYNIGVKFTSPAAEFEKIFDNEIEEISQYQREFTVYNNHKILDFRNASEAYLKK